MDDPIAVIRACAQAMRVFNRPETAAEVDRAADELERLRAAQPAVPAECDCATVPDICNAYESGVGHAGRPTASVNPYPPGTPQHTAYEIGASGGKHNAQPAVPDMDAIRQAVARGWCHPLTSRKAMDQTLAEAISEQVFAMLSATEDRKDE